MTTFPDRMGSDGISGGMGDASGPGSSQVKPCVVQKGKPNRDGYIIKTIPTSRLAWLTANGAIPDGLYVLHTCDNPACSNVDHLFLGTSDENNKDRARKGRSATGEKNGRAKLTKENVVAIRAHLSAGRSLKSIGQEFGVAATTIDEIKAGVTWRSVK